MEGDILLCDDGLSSIIDPGQLFFLVLFIVCIYIEAILFGSFNSCLSRIGWLSIKCFPEWPNKFIWMIVN